MKSRAWRRRDVYWVAVLLTASTMGAGAEEPVGATWRGLVVAAEHRCSEYNRDDDYGATAKEEKIAENVGGWWSPYDGTEFPNRESEREHIVALAEAHDSGLCTADNETRGRFNRDLDNLTLATATLNRRKGHKDAAEWKPDHNRCWFAGRVLAVKLEYGLTVDLQESTALEAMLEGCRIEDVLRPYRPIGYFEIGAPAADERLAELIDGMMSAIESELPPDIEGSEHLLTLARDVAVQILSAVEPHPEMHRAIMRALAEHEWRFDAPPE